MMRASAGKALAAAALALLCALQALTLLRAPEAWLPAAIDVSLAPGAELVLGRAELAAPQAGARHLRLRRDPDGAWFAASADGVQGLRFERSDARLRSGTHSVAAGLAWRLGATRYRVEAAGADAVRFSDGAHTWTYDGATVLRDGAALGACPGAAAGARLLGFYNRWAPAALAVRRPLRFGGNLSCATQVGNADAPLGSAALVFEDGVPVLVAAGGVERVPLLVEEQGLRQIQKDLTLAEQPLVGVGAMTVGRTRMLVRFEGGVLRLQPGGRVALFPDASKPNPGAGLPPGLRWHWAQRDAWTWPPAATAWAGLCAFAGLLAAFLARRGRQDWRACAGLGGSLALTFAGFGLLLAQRGGTAPGAAVSLLLCWAALWHAFGARSGKGGAVLRTGILLLAAGLLLQLELGSGAPDSAWLRHFQKTAAAATLGLGLLGASALLARTKPPAQGKVEALLLVLAGAALAALLLQVGWGNETGVFDLQPVEFAKLVLTVLTAHCLALGFGGSHNAGQGGAVPRALRLAAPALLFVLLLGVALVQVDDYSPLILLLVWGAAMLLAWACAARRPGPALAVAALACACLVGLALLRGAAPGDVAQWSFYGERFGVWLDPAAHPHTGQQLLLGAQAIAGGGWLGADGLFGLAALGQGALEALAIPAVQDDFAPSFLLQRHGLAAGLLLWTLQAVFLCALLHAAWRAWQVGSTARDYRQAWLGRFRCFVLCGGAAFMFGHFLLSWGTNLAFFPIMGQPMSFLSAGGSHLLFFIFPLLAAGSAAAPTTEENPPCRFTSNTKP